MQMCSLSCSMQGQFHCEVLSEPQHLPNALPYPGPAAVSHMQAGPFFGQLLLQMQWSTLHFGLSGCWRATATA